MIQFMDRADLARGKTREREAPSGLLCDEGGVVWDNFKLNFSESADPWRPPIGNGFFFCFGSRTIG